MTAIQQAVASAEIARLEKELRQAKREADALRWLSKQRHIELLRSHHGAMRYYYSLSLVGLRTEYYGGYTLIDAIEQARKDARQ